MLEATAAAIDAAVTRRQDTRGDAFTMIIGAARRKTLAEISRLTAEADRTRDDLRKPFAQAGKLAAARDRVQQIDEQLSRAAAPPRPDPVPPAAALPDWARTALRNPDDPKWLAAAAVRDGAADKLTHPGGLRSLLSERTRGDSRVHSSSLSVARR